ncbi:MAG: DMT family transporter [Hyphomicrobiales bacterium]|jgi:drug/metabolite transporter (DMT)-like permease
MANATTLTAQKTMSTASWGWLLLLGALWGMSFVFIKVAIVEIQPLTLVFLRTLLASSVLLAICRITGVRMPTSSKAWRDYAILGFFSSSLAFSLIFWAQQFIDASLSSILIAATPFFTVLLAGLLLTDERFTTQKTFGVIIGFAGVVLVIGPRYLFGLGGNLIAELAVLLAAGAYAIASIWGRRFAGEPPLATATGQITTSAVMLFPLAFVFENPLSMDTPSWSAIGAVIALAIFCTALTYLIYFRVLKMAGASNASLVGLVIPAFTMMFAVPLLGEEITLLKIVGMLVIAIGMMVLDGRPLTALRGKLRAN